MASLRTKMKDNVFANTEPWVFQTGRITVALADTRGSIRTMRSQLNYLHCLLKSPVKLSILNAQKKEENLLEETVPAGSVNVSKATR